MKITRALAWLGLALAAVLLTALTQVGGAVLLLAAILARPAARLLRWRRPAVAGTLLFVLLYLGAAFAVIPAAAPAFGREALPCFASEVAPLRAETPLFCALNRRYAAPETAQMLRDLAAHLAAAHPGTVLGYLDVGFPFHIADWFRMLPHYLHRRGTSVDLAFFYRDAAGQPASGPSPIGYFIYEQPGPDEPKPCAGVDSVARWDFSGLQDVFDGPALDEERTRTMLGWLNREGPRYDVRFVLLEAHLVQRLGVAGGVVRAQSCRAARHDDHIHVERRP